MAGNNGELNKRKMDKQEKVFIRVMQV